MDGNLLIIIGVISVSALISAAVAAVVVRRRDRKKVEYMLDSLEDGEMNFRFVERNRMNRSLNRLRWIFEKQRQRNEHESWDKLIRVLTHEIMNTVSPIASLSEALRDSVGLPDKEQAMDVKAGLETIAASSRGLIKFVETYRALSGVAIPLKKAVMLDDLMARVLQLTGAQCAAAGVNCLYSADSKDILLYVDEGQISQILVNLIKNAVQAEATRIDISSMIDSEEVTHVLVSNNGVPISRESQDQIFVPFFTTKQDGSGIGLSLSRQIMNLHNGSITLLRSNLRSTVFELIFR